MSSSDRDSNKDRVMVLATACKNLNFDLKQLKEELIEAEDLVWAAGGEVVASMTYTPARWNPATLIGRGKIEEIIEICEQTSTNILVINHQLSGIQTRNLEKALKIRVIDRAQLILDIFAVRAKTYEGKLQVELAQMLDQLPRMVGAWMGSLSRQGGGSLGARGPGETALEMDRRRIQQRVKFIRKQLEAVRKNRSTQRKRRKKNQIPNISLIGYTNSGKSTLLNTLTKSNVPTQDQVFATLDPTTNKIYMKNTGPVLITDTVGFIRELPTHLVEAFKATLEETSESDILLHVIDLSNKNFEQHIEVVHSMIKEFSWEDKPQIYVFNKSDKTNYGEKIQDRFSPKVFVSALNGDGLSDLKDLIKKFLPHRSQ